MKALLLVLLFLCSPLLTAFGRIGETYQQCIARYGFTSGVDMRRADYPLYTFRVQLTPWLTTEAVEVGVRFYNGKSAQEIYEAVVHRKDGAWVRGNLFGSEIHEILELHGLLDDSRTPNVVASHQLLDTNRTPNVVWDHESDDSGFDFLMLTTKEFERVFGSPVTGF
jgi:hypothetical protein